MKRTSICAVTTILALCLMSSLSSTAQDVFEGNQSGLPPFATFDGSNLDVVNLNNGVLHVEIPILSLRQRGRDYVYKYIFDTRTWTLEWIPNPNPRFGPLGWWVVDAGSVGDAEWRLSEPFKYTTSYVLRGEVCGVTGYNVRERWQVIDQNGTRHQVPAKQISVSQACEPTEYLNQPAVDGSGIKLELTGGWSGERNVFLTGGTRHSTIAGTLRDSNGNLSSRSGGTVTDMLNRTPLTVNNQTTYEEWTIKDSDGNPQVFRVDFVTVSVKSTDLCQSPWAQIGECIEAAPFNMTLPSKLTLPNGTSYEFTWATDSYADLLRIDLPAGGSIAYSYETRYFKSPNAGTKDPSQARRAVTTRTVTPGGMWTYDYTGSSTTVTSPLGDQEVHTLSYLDMGGPLGSTRYETKVQSYEGSAATGTLLRTVDKVYLAEAVPTENGSALPDANVRVIRETTTLEDTGQVSKVETDYETFTYQYVGGTFVASRHNPLERREHDFDSLTIPVRKTTFSYLHSGNQSYIDRNIVNRVSFTAIYDGSGALKESTTNEYDNYTEGITASGAVQHDASFGPSFTIRGNVTAVKRWRNTDAAFLTTRHQYDDAGNVLKTTDPLGHNTTIGYSDAWGNLACAPTGGNGTAYPTSSTNHLGHTSTTEYYSCTGLLASTSDINSRTTAFIYDSLGRLTETNFPDGGQVTTIFNEAGLPISSTTTQKIDPTQNLITEVEIDGLGRVSQTRLADPDCTQTWVKVDTTYDALGRKATGTNPYCTGTEATSGIATFEYDPLGRVVKVIPPDGTASANRVLMEYSGNCTTVTDHAGKKRKSCSDALGRLTQVYEPNSSGSLVNLTSYTYDVLDNLTNVTQVGSRQRTFTYNSLSQLTQAINPESGTINYTYDNDGNLKTKVAPKPNQTGSLTVTTTYN